MKHFLVLLSLAFFQLPAQITFEKTYPAGRLKRFNLDQSGETYYLQGHCNVQVFDHDHQPKGPTIQIANYGDGCGLNSISEQLFDDDPGLELITEWNSLDCHSYGAALQDDDGMMKSLWGQNPALSIPDGLPAKVIAGSRVQSVPSLAVEHDYGDGDGVTIKRVILPVEGECYVVYDRFDFEGFHIFNGNHQLLKSINLPIFNFYYLSNLTQNCFNDDALLEFHGARWLSATERVDTNRMAFQVVQENGTVLFSVPCESGQLHQNVNQSDILQIDRITPSGTWETRIIDPVSFNVLHLFEGNRPSLQKLNDNRFVYIQPQSADSTLHIYNTAFEEEKVIQMPKQYWNSTVTHGQFSGNDQYEVSFTQYDENHQSMVQCINGDGLILYTFKNASGGSIDHLPNAADKFLVEFHYDSTAVYGFTKTTEVTGLSSEPTAAVFPNPFHDRLTVTFPVDDDYRITLMNSTGQTVLEKWIRHNDKTDLAIPPALASGVYILQVAGNGRAKTVKVVKK